jgi:hypothetical protein
LKGVPVFNHTAIPGRFYKVTLRNSLRSERKTTKRHNERRRARVTGQVVERDSQRDPLTALLAQLPRRSRLQREQEHLRGHLRAVGSGHGRHGRRVLLQLSQLGP